MRDHFTGEKVSVRVDQKCGPYIMIGPGEIARVEEVLQRNGIPFSLEDGASSCKGTPETAVIDFARDADLANIQRVLDSVR